MFFSARNFGDIAIHNIKGVREVSRQQGITLYMAGTHEED
jgi:hypothetical protein